MTWLAIAFSAASVFLSLCILLPAPAVRLMPFTVAAPELAHWILLFDLLSLIAAVAFYRPAILFAAASVGVAAWPVVSAWRMGAPPIAMYRLIPTGGTQPERLPLNILYYRPPGVGPHRVLVEVYGGAWQRGEPARDEVLNRYLAA